MSKKYILTRMISLILIYGGVSRVVASDVPADCRPEFKRAVTLGQYYQYTNIFSPELRAIADHNQRNYCCLHFPGANPANDTYCDTKKTSVFMDSPWLYDHMIDVGFRFLDGIPELQYNPNKIPKKKLVDKQAFEWRSYIETKMLNQEGSPSIELDQEYKKKWLGEKTYLHNKEALEQTCDSTHTQARLAEYNNKRDETPLAHKYYVMCELASCLVSDTKNTLLPFCQRMVDERIKQENQYAQAVIVLQGQKMQQEVFTTYAEEFLTKKRMDTLSKKIVDLANGRSFVNDKIPQMTRWCNA